MLLVSPRLTSALTKTYPLCSAQHNGYLLTSAEVSNCRRSSFSAPTRRTSLPGAINGKGILALARRCGRVLYELYLNRKLPGERQVVL